jgi:hypothetical protein
VSSTDAPLICGLVWEKLTAQVEEEGLMLVASCFYRLALLSTNALVHRYSSLASPTQN